MKGNPTPITRIPEKYYKYIIRFAKIYYSTDEDCDILSQQLVLFGLRIWIHKVFAKNDICVAPTTPKHIIVAHIMLEDSVTAVLQPDDSIFELRKEEGNFFSLLAESQQASVDAGQVFTSFHVNFFPEDLPDLAQRYPVLDHFFQRSIPDKSGPLNFTPFRLNPICEFLRREVEQCEYIGLHAKYFLSRVGIDLIRNFIEQDLHTDRPGAEFGTFDENLAKLAFRRMQANNNRPININLLASHLKVSQTVLQDTFRAAYGISIQDCAHMMRMMGVYKLVADNQLDPVSITKLAGFSDVATLYHTFREYYGVDLLVLRNAQ